MSPLVCCDHCGQWWHRSPCAGLTEAKMKELKKFECATCSGGAKRRHAAPAAGGDGEEDGEEVEEDQLPAPPVTWQRRLPLLDTALRALQHQVDLELALWPSVATREQRVASLLAGFNAAATEGPCGFVKHRGERAKGTEELYRVHGTRC
eukprot:gene4150-biopygen5372